MENTVSTQVVKLDLQTILANYKDPEFWSKKWTIIDTKQIKIIWYISYINCEDNKINSTLKVVNKNIKKGTLNLSDSWWSESVSVASIPINNPEYTEKHFENAILGKVLELLSDVERHCTYEYAEYKEAERLQEEMKDKLREIASDFLDENNVTNEAIRDAYIEKYVNDNYNVEEITSKVVQRYRYKIIPNVYLYVYAWFNRQEEFEKFEAEKLGRRISTRMEIWRKVQEMQTEEWVNGMKEQLRGI